MNDLPRVTEQVAEPAIMPSGLSTEPALLITRMKTSMAHFCLRAFVLAVLSAWNNFSWFVIWMPPSHHSDLNLNVTPSKRPFLTIQFKVTAPHTLNPMSITLLREIMLLIWFLTCLFSIFPYPQLEWKLKKVGNLVCFVHIYITST